jgi:hypothetical protein
VFLQGRRRVYVCDEGEVRVRVRVRKEAGVVSVHVDMWRRWDTSGPLASWLAGLAGLAGWNLISAHTRKETAKP